MRINNISFTVRLGVAAVCLLSLLVASADNNAPVKTDKACLENAATQLAEVYSNIKFDWGPASGFKISKEASNEANKKYESWKLENKCLDNYSQLTEDLKVTPLVNLLNSGLFSLRVVVTNNKKTLSVLWSDDIVNSTIDKGNQANITAPNSTPKQTSNIDVRTDSSSSGAVVFTIILFIINIGISIFLYFLLQNKLQELIESILSIMKIDETNKKLMQSIINQNETHNTILQKQNKSYEKTQQQLLYSLQDRMALQTSLNELHKSIDKIAQLKTEQTANIPTPIQTTPPAGNSSHEIEQWNKWEETILTEYKNLMTGAKTPEEIQQFRKKYDILDIKRRSQGIFEKAQANNKDVFIWAIPKPDTPEYLVVPNYKFYNDLSAFCANDKTLAYNTFSGVIELVSQTETASEWSIKPGVVILKEDVFMVRRRGELVI